MRYLKEIKNLLSASRIRQGVVGRLLPIFVWLIIVSLLRWQRNLSFARQAQDLAGLWLGALIGAFLLDLDHLLYVLVVHPQELTSMRVSRSFQERRLAEGLILLADTQEERVRLVFRSAFFQLVFYGFCLFVLTSTGSLFGAGLVMGMALYLLKTELDCLLGGKEEFLRTRLFDQLRLKVTLRQQKAFVILMLLVFLGLNLFLI